MSPTQPRAHASLPLLLFYATPPPLCHWRTGHGAQGTSTLRERETSLRTLRERETSLRTRGLSSVTANSCNKLWCIVATAQHRIPVLIFIFAYALTSFRIPLSFFLSLSLSRRRPYFLPAPCLQHRNVTVHLTACAKPDGDMPPHTHHTRQLLLACASCLGSLGTHTNTLGAKPRRGSDKAGFFFPPTLAPHSVR